jgi:hypothetical protein
MASSIARAQSIRSGSIADLKHAGLDADARDVPASALRSLCALVALAALAAGCGAAGSSTPTAQPGPRVSATEMAQDEVNEMVLADGDLPGYSLNSTGRETLQDQLPPRRTPGYKRIVRAVKASWLASEHSVVVGADGRVAFISTANLFRSASAMREVWRMERVKVPGIRTKSYPTPAGSPPGARLVYTNDGSRIEFRLTWPQGRVIGAALIFGRPSDRLSPRAISSIAGFLATAATAQARRIGDVEADGSAT